MAESGFARYLHSAVLINGAMLIFGGNTHNDTSLSNGAKCFSADFLAYDIGMYLLGLHKGKYQRAFSNRLIACLYVILEIILVTDYELGFL